MTSRLLLAAVLLTAPASGQRPAGVLESYEAARAILTRAVAAHGGADALRAAETIRVELRGSDVQRHQSRRPSPPFDTQPRATTMMIDLPRGRLVTETRFGYIGGIVRHTGFSTNDSGRDYALNFAHRTYTVRDFPAAATQTGTLFTLPQFLVQRAAGATAPRALGRMTLSNGVEVDAVAVTVDGQPLTLGFDPDSGRLRATLGVRGDSTDGDVPTETEFTEYRMLGGVLLPTHRIVRAAGAVLQDLTFETAVANYSVPDAAAEPAAGMTEAASPAAGDPVRPLGAGVWLVSAGGTSLVIEFADHLMVVDAPGSASALRPHLETLAPGKPVRFVVPTHHHEDHALGIRGHAASGAAVVTTAANRPFFERLLTATPTSGPNAGVPPVATPRFEELSSARRVFADGRRTVEIHNVGPNPHAEDMLIAWLPAEGVLFQGDLIDVGPDGIVRPGMNNDTTAAFAGWLDRQQWNVRVFAGTHGTLRSPEDFQAVLRQPTRD